MPVVGGQAQDVRAGRGEADRRGGRGRIAEERGPALGRRHRVPADAEFAPRPAVVLDDAGEPVLAGDRRVFLPGDDLRRQVGRVAAAAARVEHLDLLEAAGRSRLVAEHRPERGGGHLVETDLVVIGPRHRGTADRGADVPPLSAVEVLDGVGGGLRVASPPFVAGEVQLDAVGGHRPPEVDVQPVLRVARAGRAPVRLVDGEPVHGGPRLVAPGLVRGADGGAFGEVLPFLADGDVTARQGEHLGQPVVLVVGDVARGREVRGPRGDHLGAALGEGDLTAGGVVDQVGQVVGRERVPAVEVHRVSLGNVLAVRACAVARPVPDHGQVPSVVVDVGDGEVRPVDVDGPQLDLVVGARPEAHRILDDRPVGGAENGVVDPRPVADVLRVRAAVGPELVLVGPVVVAADVVGPRVPGQQLGVVLVVDVLAGVVAQDRGEEAEGHRGIDDGEVVAAGESLLGRLGLVGLVGGVEGEDGVLSGVRPQPQRLDVLRVLLGRGHQSDAERVVVVDLLPGHQLAALHVPVLEEPLLGVPQVLQDRGADRVGDLPHAGRPLRLAEGVVGVRGGQRIAVDVGGFGAVQIPAPPVERHGVRVVARHVPGVVLDQAVAVLVERFELPADVLLRVVGEVAQHAVGAAVDRVRVPRRLGQVLGVAVRPVLRVAGVVGVPGVARDLAHRDPGPVGVGRFPQVLEVLHEHARGQHDGVVVAEHALHRRRELVVASRDAGVQVVVPQQPPAVVQRLLDVVVGDVHVGQVVGPPPVVLADVVGPGAHRRRVADRVVGRAGAGEFLRHEAHLHLGAGRSPGRHGERAFECAAGRGHPVAGQPRVQQGEVVAGRDGTGQFPVRRLGRVGRARANGHLPVGAALVDEVEAGDGDVVVGDELGLHDPQSAVGRVGAAPVARRLEPRGDVLLQRHFPAVHEQFDGVCGPVVDALPVGHAAGEAELRGVVRLHEQRTSARQQPVTGRVGAAPRQHPVHPEVRSVPPRQVGLVLLPQRAGDGEAFRQVRYGVLGSGEHRIPDGVVVGRGRRGRRKGDGQQRDERRGEGRRAASAPPGGTHSSTSLWCGGAGRRRAAAARPVRGAREPEGGTSPVFPASARRPGRGTSCTAGPAAAWGGRCGPAVRSHSTGKTRKRYSRSGMLGGPEKQRQEGVRPPTARPVTMLGPERRGQGRPPRQVRRPGGREAMVFA